MSGSVNSKEAAQELHYLKKSELPKDIKDYRAFDVLLETLGKDIQDSFKSMDSNLMQTWWDPECNTLEYLENKLANAIREGNLLEISGFSAMLHIRKSVKVEKE